MQIAPSFLIPNSNLHPTTQISFPHNSVIGIFDNKTVDIKAQESYQVTPSAPIEEDGRFRPDTEEKASDDEPKDDVVEHQQTLCPSPLISATLVEDGTPIHRRAYRTTGTAHNSTNSVNPDEVILVDAQIWEHYTSQQRRKQNKMMDDKLEHAEAQKKPNQRAFRFEHENRKSKIQWLIVFGLILISLAAVAVVFVFVALRSGNNEKVRQQSDMELLLASRYSMVNGTDFKALDDGNDEDDYGRYRIKALRYVEETSVGMPEWRIGQRYALACIYYATSDVVVSQSDFSTSFAPTSFSSSSDASEDEDNEEDHSQDSDDEDEEDRILDSHDEDKEEDHSLDSSDDSDDEDGDDEDHENGAVQEWIEKWANGADSINECNWFGVQCNMNEIDSTGMYGNVIKIEVPNNGLAGPFPLEVALLKDTLESLRLANNHVLHSSAMTSDEDLNWLGDMSQLKILDLSQTMFFSHEESDDDDGEE